MRVSRRSFYTMSHQRSLLNYSQPLPYPGDEVTTMPTPCSLSFFWPHRNVPLRQVKSLVRKRRTAFTLIELLVVLAVIGLLAALLFPAVQFTREAARRTSCKSKLRQIGLATQMYHDTFKTLPPGWLANDPASGWPDPEGEPEWGWAANIFPFLEQSNLVDRSDFGRPIADAANEVARATVLPIYSLFVGCGR